LQRSRKAQKEPHPAFLLAFLCADGYYLKKIWAVLKNGKFGFQNSGLQGDYEVSKITLGIMCFLIK
jgi:hypothetical protein